jgi:hypothetical protein
MAASAIFGPFAAAMTGFTDFRLVEDSYFGFGELFNEGILLHTTLGRKL